MVQIINFMLLFHSKIRFSMVLPLEMVMPAKILEMVMIAEKGEDCTHTVPGFPW